MGDLTLHPTLGVNARLTYCPRCGGDGPDLMLIGNRNFKFECERCKTVSFGERHCIACKKKGEHAYSGKLKELDEFERMPGSLCKACETELAEWNDIVTKGGIYWHCKDCHKQGVVHAHAPLAKAVRKDHPAPDPIGFEFDKTTCPVCGPDKIV